MGLKDLVAQWRALEISIIRGIEQGAKLLNKYALNNQFDRLFIKPKNYSERTSLNAWHLRYARFFIVAVPLAVGYYINIKQLLIQNYKKAQEFHLDSALQAMLLSDEKTQRKPTSLDIQGGREILFSEYYAKYEHNRKQMYKMMEQAEYVIEEFKRYTPTNAR